MKIYKVFLVGLLLGASQFSFGGGSNDLVRTQAFEESFARYKKLKNDRDEEAYRYLVEKDYKELKSTVEGLKAQLKDDYTAREGDSYLATLKEMIAIFEGRLNAVSIAKDDLEFGE